FIADGDFQHHLRHKTHIHPCSAISFGVAFLSAKTFDFKRGDTQHTQAAERGLDRIHLGGLHNGFYHLHNSAPSGLKSSTGATHRPPPHPKANPVPRHHTRPSAQHCLHNTRYYKELDATLPTCAHHSYIPTAPAP